MKPESILKLEKEFNVNIYNIKDKDSFDIWRDYNSFELNNKNELIGLKLQSIKLNDFTILKELETLIYLELTNSNIQDIYFLKYLKNIQVLNLSSNSIENISVISNLEDLEELNVTHNNIRTFKILENLKKLKTLKYGRNPCWNISYLKGLKNLINLDISYSKSFRQYLEPDFNFLSDFKHIEGLTLMHNEIENLSFLKGLKNLKRLNLVHNKILDISVIGGLNFLEKLWLQDNIIYDISPLNELLYLNYLDISINHIHDVSHLKNLLLLSNLKINNNNISDITDILKINSLKKVDLLGNKKIEIDFPSEIIKAGWASIKQYSEDSKERIPFKNVKVLLLGNPNIGKSNLLEYFETNECPIRKDTTHGVVYKKINLNEINYHIWDFGGQEYFHATHQLFFSNNAINLVLWGVNIPRANVIESCFQIDYWLRIITQLNGGKDEIAFLIENKIDLNVPKYSETPISTIMRNKFSNLRIYDRHISLTEMKNLVGLKEKIFVVADEIINKFQYPKLYEVFLNRINNLQKDYVTIVEINNRPNEDNVLAAVKVFHNMGILLYFPDIIPDKIFHKPQVLLELLYNKVLGPKKNLKITNEEIRKSLLYNSLGLNESEIISLLKHFNLVFQVEAEKSTYFIPQYLLPQSKSQETYEKLGFSFCNIKIRADHYLMSLAMLKIFSNYGNYVDSEKEEYLFWQNGIVILKDNQNLMIKYIPQQQTIELYTSNRNDNKLLQKEIVDFILDLPEDISLPKRNFENHRKKRWIEIIDENDVDFSPHFSERIYEYKGYLEEFESRDWENNYKWHSKFFDVYVGFDGEFFIQWEELKINEDLSEINFINENGINKKIQSEEYYYLIDKVLQMNKKNNNEKSVTNIFNGPVNAGIIGDNGRINAQDIVTKEESKPSFVKGLSNDELTAVKKWKTIALLGFIIYILASTYLIYFYSNESMFNMSQTEWDNLKQSEFSKLLIFIWGGFGIYLFYKLIYDRFLDPSKENAFIDLYRKHKKEK